MASASVAVAQRNQDATVYVGGLDERVDDELLWELFVQVGSPSSATRKVLCLQHANALLLDIFRSVRLSMFICQRTRLAALIKATDSLNLDLKTTRNMQ